MKLIFLFIVIGTINGALIPKNNLRAKPYARRTSSYSRVEIHPKNASLSDFGDENFQQISNNTYLVINSTNYQNLTNEETVKIGTNVLQNFTLSSPPSKSKPIYDNMYEYLKGKSWVNTKRRHHKYFSNTDGLVVTSISDDNDVVTCPDDKVDMDNLRSNLVRIENVVKRYQGLKKKKQKMDGRKKRKGRKWVIIDEFSDNRGIYQQEKKDEDPGFWNYLYGIMFQPEHNHEHQNNMNEQVTQSDLHRRQDTINAHPCDLVPGDYHQWFRQAKAVSVIVIGGGAAGLAALKTLNSAGLEDTILLEAQNRLGGRIHTIRQDSWLVDEGPSFIKGGQDNSVYQIAKEMSALAPQLDDNMYQQVVVTSDGGEMDSEPRYKGFKILKSIQNEIKLGGLRGYHGQTVGQHFIDRFENMWGPDDSDTALAWMFYMNQELMREEYSADLWNVSARDADNFKHLEEEYRFKQGFDTLIKYLMESISPSSILTSKPVCQIFWDLPDRDETLVVTSGGESYLASYVISTIPIPPLKQRHRSTFFPSLPASMIQALDGIDLGVMNKIFMGWYNPWWGAKPLDLNIYWTDYNFPAEMEWISAIVRIKSCPHNPIILEMSIGEEASITMESLSNDLVISHLVQLLKTVTNNGNIRLPNFFHRSRWSQNQWIGGSWKSYINRQGDALGLKNRLAFAPILKNSQNHQKIYFAGEHTSNTRFGTVDGDIETGVRAAKWLLDEHVRLGRPFIPSSFRNSNVQYMQQMSPVLNMMKNPLNKQRAQIEQFSMSSSKPVQPVVQPNRIMNPNYLVNRHGVPNRPQSPINSAMHQDRYIQNHNNNLKIHENLNKDPYQYSNEYEIDESNHEKTIINGTMVIYTPEMSVRHSDKSESMENIYDKLRSTHPSRSQGGVYDYSRGSHQGHPSSQSVAAFTDKNDRPISAQVPNDYTNIHPIQQNQNSQENIRGDNPWKSYEKYEIISTTTEKQPFQEFPPFSSEAVKNHHNSGSITEIHLNGPNQHSSLYSGINREPSFQEASKRDYVDFSNSDYFPNLQPQIPASTPNYYSRKTPTTTTQRINIQHHSHSHKTNSPNILNHAEKSAPDPNLSVLKDIIDKTLDKLKTRSNNNKETQSHRNSDDQNYHETNNQGNGNSFHEYLTEHRNPYESNPLIQDYFSTGNFDFNSESIPHASGKSVVGSQSQIGTLFQNMKVDKKTKSGNNRHGIGKNNDQLNEKETFSSVEHDYSPNSTPKRPTPALDKKSIQNENLQKLIIHLGNQATNKKNQTIEIIMNRINDWQKNHGSNSSLPRYNSEISSKNFNHGSSKNAFTVNAPTQSFPKDEATMDLMDIQLWAYLQHLNNLPDMSKIDGLLDGISDLSKTIKYNADEQTASQKEIIRKSNRDRRRNKKDRKRKRNQTGSTTTTTTPTTTRTTTTQRNTRSSRPKTRLLGSNVHKNIKILAGDRTDEQMELIKQLIPNFKNLPLLIDDHDMRYRPIQGKNRANNNNGMMARNSQKISSDNLSNPLPTSPMIPAHTTVRPFRPIITARPLKTVTTARTLRPVTTARTLRPVTTARTLRPATTARSFRPITPSFTFPPVTSTSSTSSYSFTTAPLYYTTTPYPTSARRKRITTIKPTTRSPTVETSSKKKKRKNKSRKNKNRRKPKSGEWFVEYED